MALIRRESAEERQAYVEAKAAERKRIQEEIQRLAAERDAFLAAVRARLHSATDEALRSQMERMNYRLVRMLRPGPLQPSPTRTTSIRASGVREVELLQGGDGAHTLHRVVEISLLDVAPGDVQGAEPVENLQPGDRSRASFTRRRARCRTARRR